MAYGGQNTELKYFLNGSEVDRPEEDIEIEAHFGNNVQANIATSEFTFVNEEATFLKNWYDAGRVFEGVPYKIEAYNNTGNLIAFDGYLDMSTFSDTFNFNGRVGAGIIKDSGLNTLEVKLSALTFALLEDKGVFTSSDYNDLEYIVEEKINLFEELVSAIMLYLMIKEFKEAVRRTADDIAQVVAIATGGFPGTGALASLVLAIVKAALSVAYTAIILVTIIDLSQQLLNTFLPPIRKHKLLKYQTAMEKICGYLGFTFDSDIADLNEWFYLPSNPRLNDNELSKWLTINKGTPTGLPNVSDIGYQCSQFFEMVRRLVNGKFALVGNVVYLRNENSPFWIKQSTWVKPNPLETIETNNAGDLIATKTFSFQSDITDEWTVDDTTGFHYEVRIDAPSIPQARKQIKGYEDTNFGLSLGTRRNKLNPLEEFLKTLATNIDALVTFFGGSSNLAQKIDDKRLGMLRQSDNWHSTPKLIKLQGKKLPTNYRQTLSAKYIYNTYYIGDSFAVGVGQKRLFKESIPFGFNDAVSTLDNSYFYDEQGNTCKIISLSWATKEDKAEIAYWKQINYTNVLQETYKE
jgi:hypothetical protein